MSISKCIFCNQENLAILIQDAKYLLFRDIRPSAEHHYLVIPKEHVLNPKYLNREHVPMIQEMKTFALNYAQSNIDGLNVDKLRLGFHWAPFNTIAHLHLHILYPTDQMSFISRTIFRPNSWWFSEVDQTIEHLEKVNPPPPSTS